MGRYYYGDIEGKFWFGIQSSTDASFFGADHYEILRKKCGCEVKSGCDCSDVDHECISDCDSDCSIEKDENTVKQDEDNDIAYDFEEEHIPLVKTGIERCEKEIYTYKERLDTFFEQNDSYTDEGLCNFIGCSKDEIRDILMWYARLRLGKKILLCLEENRKCHFACDS